MNISEVIDSVATASNIDYYIANNALNYKSIP